MKKRFALLIITLLTLMTLPAVAVKTVSVKELGALIADMQQQNKPDSNIADRLKGVNLSEQLTPAVIDEFRSMNLGPLSLEQIRILAVESALLPPPGTELPSTVAPDVDAQKGILGKTVNYISDFTHLPKLDADKTTVRYQDGPDYVLASNGGGTLMAQADIGQQFSPDNPYLRTLGQHTVAVEVMGGVELRPAKLKAGDPSTQNGQISQGGPGPVLGVAFEEAARGKLQFARWETVDGKPLAVFSYEVPKKQSHYEVNYCCFPKTENTGSHLGGPSGSSLTPGGGGGGGGAPEQLRHADDLRSLSREGRLSRGVLHRSRDRRRASFHHGGGFEAVGLCPAGRHAHRLCPGRGGWQDDAAAAGELRAHHGHPCGRLGPANREPADIV